MIVRDEAEMLPACLASVAGAVDQIVVVDTGSVDETVEIARLAAAHVVQHPWRDDFADARNAALSFALGDYVLILDADEQLAPGAAKALRSALLEAPADCYLLPLHNADALDAAPAEVLAGSRREGGIAYLPRLLRLTPDLRWEGTIHEHIRSWLQRHQASRLLPGVAIIHYGYVPEIWRRRDKGTRNQRMLEQRCRDEPNNPDPRAYLARDLVARGDPEAALELALEAWELLRRLPAPDRLRPIGASLVSTTLELLSRHTDPLTALPYASEALTWGHTHPDALFFCGITLERAAEVEDRSHHLREALGCYRRALASDEPGTLPVTRGLRASTLPLRMGLAQCKLGDHEAALESLASVRPTVPDTIPLQLALAEALTDAQRHDEALQLLEPTLGTDSSDPWWLGAEIVWRLGLVQDAIHFLKHARQLGPPLETHRQRRGATLIAEIQRHLQAQEVAP
ncbi:MAG TPA: glycosyltransferase [Deltaproteobacteria bacterium]|nr:glycosyltransferase [Deltaproteobacteria bacterium]